MGKKIYGISEAGEKIELNFKEFLIITENDSKLEINTAVKEHHEKPDLALHVCHGPLEILGEDNGSKMVRPLEGNRYFSILPGGSNLFYIKVIQSKLK